jgi:hypothetical protein
MCKLCISEAPAPVTGPKWPATICTGSAVRHVTALPQLKPIIKKHTQLRMNIDASQTRSHSQFGGQKQARATLIHLSSLRFTLRSQSFHANCTTKLHQNFWFSRHCSL